jgi:mono/diheme cytochrome c family protein
MSNETLFYICGVILALSAVGFSLVGLKVKGFPGRAMPVVVLWFAVFIGGATTFAVQNGKDEAHHREAELQQASKEVEEPEGESEEAPEEAPEEAAEEGEAAGEGGTEAGATGDASAGSSIFAENCSVCHGATGHGGAGGPDLRTMPLAQTEAGAVQQVTNGGGGMPPFGGQLSSEEISDVAAYVVHEIVGK